MRNRVEKINSYTFSVYNKYKKNKTVTWVWVIYENDIQMYATGCLTAAGRKEGEILTLEAVVPEDKVDLLLLAFFIRSRSLLTKFKHPDLVENNFSVFPSD